MLINQRIMCLYILVPLVIHLLYFLLELLYMLIHIDHLLMQLVPIHFKPIILFSQKPQVLFRFLFSPSLLNKDIVLDGDFL